MPISVKSSILSASLMGLAACGGSGGGLGGASGAATALNYDPVYTSTSNPTIGTAMGSTGVTGVAILADRFGGDVSFLSTKIAVSGDKSTVTLTFNGQNYVLTQQSSISYSSDDFIFNLALDEDEAFDYFGATGASLNTLGFVFGYVGVETPLNQLPSGDTRYVGSLTTAMTNTDSFGSDAQVTGQIYLTANFQNQAISGVWKLGLETTGDPRGTISGSTSGNGVLGTITLAPESGYSGDLAIVAKLFGDGETLAGVAGANNLTSLTNGNNYMADGTFELTQPPTF